MNYESRISIRIINLDEFKILYSNRNSEPAYQRADS